jgi:hypothetical protein
LLLLPLQRNKSLLSPQTQLLNLWLKKPHLLSLSRDKFMAALSRETWESFLPTLVMESLLHRLLQPHQQATKSWVMLDAALVEALLHRLTLPHQ